MAYIRRRYRLQQDQIARMRGLLSKVDTAPGPGGSRITPTNAFDGELGPIVDRWVAASVVALYPSSQLVAHRDPPIVSTRYHIPLVVNDGCWVFHKNDWQQLEVGCLYEMDPTEEHGAVNWGAEVRYHLIVDV